MKTDRLIDVLTDDASPLREDAVRTLALGLGAGAIISFAIMLLWLGIRPDIAAAVATWGYWAKFLYTLGFAVLGFFTVERLTRPGVEVRRQAVWEIAPFAAIALAAVAQWNAAPADQHISLLMGGSNTVCPWRIVILSLPLLAGTLLGMRTLAPTRPMLAGGAAGLLAGSAGAWIYAFACGETSAVFVAVWYTAGIALMGVAGMAIGQRVLRW